MLVAVADTTGDAVTVAAFNVLHNSQIYKKLAAELRARFPDSDSEVSSVELEKLSYLVTHHTLPPLAPQRRRDLTTTHLPVVRCDKRMPPPPSSHPLTMRNLQLALPPRRNDNRHFVLAYASRALRLPRPHEIFARTLASKH